jgi:hypothetical protein
LLQKDRTQEIWRAFGLRRVAAFEFSPASKGRDLRIVKDIVASATAEKSTQSSLTRRDLFAVLDPGLKRPG